MTPEFCCGFECGVTTSPAHVTTLGGATFNTNASFVRSGARSLRCNPSATTIEVGIGAIFSSTTRHIGRFYVYFTTLPSADTALACFATSTNPVGPNVRFKQSDSKIYAAVGSTLGASGVSVTTGQWYRIDYDFNVNTSGADFCDVQVDGVACGQATATGLSSAFAQDRIGVLVSCSTDLYFDDYIFSSTSADYPIGAGYVNHFVPTADGTHNIAGTADFQRGNTGTDILNATTTAFQLVDDVPLPSGTVDEADNVRAVAPPNATDYVEGVFGPASGISTPTAGPRAVEVILAYHQIATQTGQMVVALNDNGSIATILDTGAAAGVTTYRYARAHFADPPSAASVWNAANDGGNGDFRDLRFRFRAPDAAPDQCLDAIMIEAEFAPGFSTLERSGLIDGVGAVTSVPQRDLLRTAALNATATIASVPQRELIRSAAIDAAGGISVSAVFFSVFERTTAIDATATIESSATFFSTLERSATLDAVADISSSAVFFTEFERSVALDAAGAVTVSGQKESQRSAAIDAVAAVTSGGVVESGAETFERSAAIDAAGAVTVAGQSDMPRAVAVDAIGAIVSVPQRDLLRSALIDAVGAVAVAPQRNLLRSVAIDGVGAVTVSGEIQGTASRSVALDAIGAITTVGQRELLRSVAIDAVADIATSATFFTTFERSSAVDASATVTISGQIIPQRAVSVSATASVAVSGQRDLQRNATINAAATIVVNSQRDLQRAAAFNAIGNISTSFDIAPGVLTPKYIAIVPPELVRLAQVGAINRIAIVPPDLSRIAIA